MSPRFGDLPRRLASALVLAPIALLCLWLGGALWVALVVLAGVAVAIEWARVCRFAPASPPGVFLPVLVAAAAATAATDHAPVALGILAGGGILLAAARGDGEGPRLWLAGGAVFVGLAAVAAVWLRLHGSAGPGNMLFVVLIVWASDSGAYLVGRIVGGPKLVPRLSPAKTWAGAIGGLVFAVAAGLLVAAGLAAGPSLGVAAASATLGVASQGGDLLESAFKRRFGVKNSGSLIPGHGGVLDRLDGILAAAPAAAALVLVLGRGAALWR